MINASTDLYCVLGSPVSHSQSPLVHNISFRKNKINAVYLAFEPPDIAAAILAIDSALIGYANMMRLQRFIGNVCLTAERELFGQEPLSALHGAQRRLRSQEIHRRRLCVNRCRR